MPKIINQDLIAQIAELAGRGYSKAAAGRELKLDRATVGKYWPEEKEESEVKATPEVKLSLEDELRLITTKNGLIWDIDETLNKIKERDWETPELRKQGQLATDSLRFLKEKVEKAETLDELTRLSNLVNRNLGEVKPILEKDIKLEKERLEREEKEWQEEAAKRRELHESQWRHYYSVLPWYVPCPKYTEDVLGTFLVKYGTEWGKVLGAQLLLVNEFKWDDDIAELEPLFLEFLNIITGHPEEKDSIIRVMEQRMRWILTAGDEDATNAFNQWLSAEEDDEFVAGALKLAGQFRRLAEQRYMDIGGLLKQEVSLPKESAKGKRSKADKAHQTLA